MTYLPRRKTRCHGMGCPIALQCLRHVAPCEPNQHYSWVASAHEPGELDCRYFIPTTDEHS